MIYSGSRYVDGLAVVQQDDTVAIRRVFPRTPREFVLYTWKSTDRLDIIAARRLGGPQNWWRILDANPLVQNPSDILPGQQIRIPTSV
jgi:nucleoid-associated protein YgaU